MPSTSATLLERLRDRTDAEAWQRLIDLYSPGSVQIFSHIFSRQPRVWPAGS